jgi:hypothetical protein
MRALKVLFHVAGFVGWLTIIVSVIRQYFGYQPVNLELLTGLSLLVSIAAAVLCLGLYVTAVERDW